MAQLPSTASIKDIIAALQTMEAINQKADLAAAVGSPALSTDDVATIISKLQTQKNNLATNLSNKGTPSTGSETLKALVDKLAALPVKKIATGTIGAVTGAQTVAGLAFRPSIVYVYTTNPGNPNTNPYEFHVLFDVTKYTNHWYWSGWGRLGGLWINGNNSLTQGRYEANADGSANKITATGFLFDKKESIGVSWVAIEG